MSLYSKSIYWLPDIDYVEMAGGQDKSHMSRRFEMALIPTYMTFNEQV